MNAPRTYLDHNATAPLRPAARDALLAALEVVGNASSVHAEGRRARGLIEDAREQVAALVNARPAEIVFTSGATEANNWVMTAGWDAVLVSGIEHDSVLAPARASGARVIELPAGADGTVAVETVAAQARESAGAMGRAIVTLQRANNETGALQPVAETAAVARAHGLCVHTDAVQAVGRHAVDFAALGVDALSLSSHKIGGPKGVGALVVRDGVRLPPFIVGGGQERRRRAGTEDVAAIAGFGAAAAAAQKDLERTGRITALRDRLEQEAVSIAPQAVVIAGQTARLPNTTCLALPEQSAEVLVIKLDLSGIAVSAGAACSSGKVGQSHVLTAMGIAPDLARAAIRISLGWNSTEADVDAFLRAWGEIAGSAARKRAVA
jgi:cysteine desulfurase